MRRTVRYELNDRDIVSLLRQAGVELPPTEGSRTMPVLIGDYEYSNNHEDWKDVGDVPIVIVFTETYETPQAMVVHLAADTKRNA